MLRQVDDVPEMMKRPAEPRREGRGENRQQPPRDKPLRLLLCCARMRDKMRADSMQNQNSEARRNEERETL